MSPSDKQQQQAAAAASAVHNNDPDGDDDNMEDDSKTFPMKLVEILGDERYEEAICWLPHGRAFIIRNRKLFAETVMPLHFSRKAKYSSFTRKLNRWNFVRVSSGPEIGAYYHEFFLRDKPHLAAQMFCKNARTKLAMLDMSTPKPTAASAAAAAAAAATSQKQQQQKSTSSDASSSAAAPPAVASAANQHPQEQVASAAQLSQFPPGLMSILQQDPDECCDNKFAHMNMANNLQLLERQMQFLQEEHAQRMLLQRMAANRMMLQQQAAAAAAAAHAAAAASMPMPFHQQMQLHQQPNMAMSSSGAAAMSSSPHEQQEQLMHMRQMMELRNSQRDGLAPTNPRASAA